MRCGGYESQSSGWNHGLQTKHHIFMYYLLVFLWSNFFAYTLHLISWVPPKGSVDQEGHNTHR